MAGTPTQSGSASILSDCADALEALSFASGGSSSEIRLMAAGAESTIRALRRSLLLIGDGVSVGSDGTLAGSLVQLALTEGSGGLSTVGDGDAGLARSRLDYFFFDKLADSSESEVRGPWIKPIRRCSRAHDQCVLVRARVGMGGVVESLAALGDGAHLFPGMRPGWCESTKLSF